MKAQLSGLIAKYDALALRERRLVALALLGGVLLIGGSVFVEPAYTRLQSAGRGVVEQRAQLAALQVQSEVLQAPGQDPEVRARAELAALKVQLNTLHERLSRVESTLVTPQRMTGLLENMLGRRSGLRVLSLRTLPVTPLLEKKESAGIVSGARGAAEGLYKHGVEIRLEGSYAELADYLQRLENSSQQLIWSSANLSAEKHPKLVLVLTVFTLSLDKTWLMI
ncbi:MAG: hypothetical protein WCK63_15330 [Betaproteobacteria bacterium]